METSNIILYENCKLKPEKNFMADNISDFLNDCTSNLVVANQQYIKHNLNLEVKLISPEYPSGLSLSYNQGKNYNYYVRVFLKKSRNAYVNNAERHSVH